MTVKLKGHVQVFVLIIDYNKDNQDIIDILSYVVLLHLQYLNAKSKYIELFVKIFFHHKSEQEMIISFVIFCCRKINKNV